MGRNKGFFEPAITAPYLHRPYLGWVWACDWYRSRIWSMWCISDSMIWSLVCITCISLCIWCMGVYIQVNKQMSYLYIGVRVVGYMIRYILVPVLIADPRATVILLTYMCAYLDRWKHIIHLIYRYPAAHVGYSPLYTTNIPYTHAMYISIQSDTLHTPICEFQKIWSFK